MTSTPPASSPAASSSAKAGPRQGNPHLPADRPPDPPAVPRRVHGRGADPVHGPVARPAERPGHAGRDRRSAAWPFATRPFDGPGGRPHRPGRRHSSSSTPRYRNWSAAQMELVVAGHAEAVNMIELGGKEVSGRRGRRGHQPGLRRLPDQVIEHDRRTGREGRRPEELQAEPAARGELAKLVDRQGAAASIRQAKQIPGKAERNEAMDQIRDELLAELCPEGARSRPIHARAGEGGLLPDSRARSSAR